jgi:hypothetical protein
MVASLSDGWAFIQKGSARSTGDLLCFRFAAKLKNSRISRCMGWLLPTINIGDKRRENVAGYCEQSPTYLSIAAMLNRRVTRGRRRHSGRWERGLTGLANGKTYA